MDGSSGRSLGRAVAMAYRGLVLPMVFGRGTPLNVSAECADTPFADPIASPKALSVTYRRRAKATFEIAGEVRRTFVPDA